MSSISIRFFAVLPLQHEKQFSCVASSLLNTSTNMCLCVCLYVSAGGQRCCVFPPQSPKSNTNPNSGPRERERAREPVFLQSKGKNINDYNTHRYAQTQVDNQLSSAQSVRKVRNCRCGSVFIFIFLFCIFLKRVLLEKDSALASTSLHLYL